MSGCIGASGTVGETIFTLCSYSGRSARAQLTLAVGQTKTFKQRVMLVSWGPKTAISRLGAVALTVGGGSIAYPSGDSHPASSQHYTTPGGRWQLSVGHIMHERGIKT